MLYRFLLQPNFLGSLLGIRGALYRNDGFRVFSFSLPVPFEDMLADNDLEGRIRSHLTFDDRRGMGSCVVSTADVKGL